MKRILLLVLLLVSASLTVKAQGVHGRIFILGDSVNGYQTKFESQVSSYYLGAVDSGYSLPASLSAFDAILDFQSNHDDTLSIADQLRLIDFIKNGGRFYAEVIAFHQPNSDASIADTLWHFIGYDGVICDDVMVWYDSIYGADSLFTSGISVSWQHPDPLQYDGSPCYLLGQLQPVLWEHEGNDGVDDPIAWIPLDRSIRAVLGFSAVPPTFYPKMLCNYFGLCADIVTAKPATPPISLCVASTGAGNTILVTGEGSGELEISNDLGIPVFAKHARGGDEITVPKHLANGVYFARLTSKGGSITKSFTILQK